MKSATLFLFAFGTIAHGQDHLDSLWRTWEDRTHPDTVRLSAIKGFIWDGPLFNVPDSALVLARMMFDTASSMGRKEQMSAALNMQAIVSAMRGEHDVAIEHYHQALKLSREVGDVKGEVTALKNIGGSFYMMGEAFDGLRYMSQALDLTRSSGDRMEANLLTSMALAYTKMDDHEQADAHARSGLEIAERIGDSKEILYAATVLGDNLMKQDRVDEALPFYERSLALAEALDDKRNMAAGLIGLSKVHVGRGEFSQAITFGERALELDHVIGDRAGIEQAYLQLFEAYKGAGRTAQALEMLERYMELHDEVRSDENKAALLRLKIQSDFDLKEAVLRAEMEKNEAVAAQEIRRQKVVRHSMMAGALLLLAGIGAWFLADRRRRQERYQKQAAELQTQILRSQMNPHFIFNALNSINAYVQRDDADGASSYLSKFARVMRGVLENSRHREVTLQDDLETLRGYMELERRRMDNKFDFTIDVDADIDPEQVMVPPLVVQPLVENAIWHGIADKEGRGRITLRIDLQGDQLVWCLEDDGVGRGATKTPQPERTAQGPGMKKTSLGTAITRSRLELLQQQAGGRAGFRYEDLQQGTRVVVDMPLVAA